MVTVAFPPDGQPPETRPGTSRTEATFTTEFPPCTARSHMTSEVWRPDMTSTQELDIFEDEFQSRPPTGQSGFGYDAEQYRPLTGRTDRSEDLYMLNGVMPTRYPTEELKEDGVRPDTSRIYHAHQPNYSELQQERLPPIDKPRKKPVLKKKGAFKPLGAIDERGPRDRPPTGGAEYGRPRGC